MGKFNRGHTKAAKLTASQVLEMRELYHEQGWTQSALSRRYSISVVQIGRIVRGESWQQFAQPLPEVEIQHSEAILSTVEPVELNLPDSFAEELRALQSMPQMDKVDSVEEVDAVEMYLRSRGDGK